MKAHEILSSKEKWCKGTFAQLVSGEDCHPSHPNAVRWCLAGAIERAYADTGSPAWTDALNQALAGLPDPAWNLALFNDNPETTFEGVHQLLFKADI